MTDLRMKLMGYMIDGSKYLKDRFYTKPQTLGEGLQRVKQKFGAKGNVSIMEGFRRYENGVEFNLSPEFQQIGSDGIMSQLRIYPKKGKKFIAEYTTFNNHHGGKDVIRSLYTREDKGTRMSFMKGLF